MDERVICQEVNPMCPPFYFSDTNKVLPLTSQLILLKVLRNFGHKIANIELHYSGRGGDHEPNIEVYLAEYCSKSLKKLFVCDRNFVFENIEKPLTNVKSIVVRSCIIRSKLFKKCFPNLESLCLEFNEYENWSVLEHLPNLKQLSLRTYHKKSLQKDTFMELIKLNPQLEELKLFLDENCALSYIQGVTEYLPAIKTFSISNMCKDLSPLVVYNHEPFHFNNVVDFRLELRGTFNFNLFTFSKLQRISLSCDVNFDDINAYQPLLNLIHRNNKLTSIELYGHMIGKLDALFESEYILSNIEELSILHYKFIYPKIIRYDPRHTLMCSVLRFLERCQSIKKLVIKGEGCLDYMGFPIFCDVIASHTTAHKIMAEGQTHLNCKKCNWKLPYKSVEFSIKKPSDSTLTRYVCTFKNEINMIVSLALNKLLFIVIECSKIEE
ncbi:uncharacterized protein LOC129567274 isoform X2 [Sitodiplosis mosellana]|uniref:uncharacterized protein LOC129567274 isoform X2 n=1 Tax=Sitodiplosis mosellana TaxID=263140 RepID=UPI0024452422|nr:uncharacterized protein LOC129567274 isoform X2 [Sitodiplosis mosellana]